MSSVDKICSICELDVANQKRFKDAEGNYFCKGCWDTRTALSKSGEDSQLAEPPIAPSPTATVPAIKSTLTSNTSANSTTQTPTSDDNIGLQKIKYVAIGLAAVAYFDGWPIYQASQHADHFMVSLKGIMVGWFAMCVFLIIALPGQMGLTWKRAPGDVASSREKHLIRIYLGVAFTVGLVMSGLTDYYIRQQGYTVEF